MIIASLPERINASTCLVGALPQRSQTTFGGEPYKRLLSAKSASCETMQKLLALANFQISVSVFSAKS